MAAIRAPHIRSGALRSSSALIAWILWGFSVALLIGLIPLLVAVTATASTNSAIPEQIAQKLAVSGPTAIYLVFGYLAVLACSTLGAVIITRQRENRIGWIFCIVGLANTSETFAAYYACYTLLAQPRSLPGGLAAAWLQNWVWVVSSSLLCVFLPLLFPNGRLLSRRWRLVGWISACVIAALAFAAAFHTGSLWNYLESAHINNPLGVKALHELIADVEPILFVLFLLMMLLAACSLILRLRRATGDERMQIKWFAYFGAVLAVVFVAQGIVDSILQASPPAFEAVWQIAWSIAFLSLPIAVGIAILKYHLYAIDILINRTLVYGALSACVVGLYALIVGGASALFQSRANFVVSLLATGVVAVLFQPLRERLQRWVNRLLYGEREEPYAVLSTLGRRLEGALSPDETLPAVVETVAQALKLPYAAISLRDGEQAAIAASYGERAGEPLPLDLTYQGETVGQLLLCPRAPSEGWPAKERRLLDDLARQAGVAAHAVELHTELRRARERLVIAREEERRRLRRDLHDGLGPQLASQTLTLSAASKLLRADPAAAEELLSEALTHAQTAVSDIRRLVYGLRPPALDDLGLVGALTDQAAQYSASGLRVTVTAPDPFPPLPAAVEVACYRIAQEALTNVARHAQARSATLALAVDTPNQALTLAVVDDGCGLPAQLQAGVGLASMRERAAELGGACFVETAPGGGVRVYARLPLAS